MSRWRSSRHKPSRMCKLDGLHWKVEMAAKALQNLLVLLKLIDWDAMIPAGVAVAKNTSTVTIAKTRNHGIP